MEDGEEGLAEKTVVGEGFGVETDGDCGDRGCEGGGIKEKAGIEKECEVKGKEKDAKQVEERKDLGKWKKGEKVVDREILFH